MNFAKHWAARLDDYVMDLAWSPDGALLAAASAAGSLALYDAASGTVRHLLPGHADGANVLVWQPTAPGETARPAASVRRDAQSEFAASSVGPSPPADPVGATPSQPLPSAPLRLASGGQDGWVRFWDAGPGVQTAATDLGPSWVEHLVWGGPGPFGAPLPHSDPAASSSAVSSILFAAAGRQLVALRADGTVAHRFPPAPKSLTALAYAPRGASGSARLAAAYFGGVCVWDATGFAAVREYAYGNAIHALTWSPDGRWLVAGCQDNAVHLWVPDEDLELHMSGYETKLKELAFSADSQRLATGGGRDVCVWDCSGAGPEGRVPLLLPHGSRVQVVAFQHRHDLLATGAADGGCTLWAPTRKQPLFAEARLPAAPCRLAWSADDRLLAAGTEAGQIFVFRTD